MQIVLCKKTLSQHFELKTTTFTATYKDLVHLLPLLYINIIENSLMFLRKNIVQHLDVHVCTSHYCGI